MLLTDLFPTRVRFSGVALGFNVAFTIFSGTAPLVGDQPDSQHRPHTAPAFIMVACGLITLVGSLGCRGPAATSCESSAAFQM